MGDVFRTILLQPVFNLLIFFYTVIPDIGVAIFLVTVSIRLALWPLSRQSLRAQKALQEIQPKVERIKHEHKGDLQAQQRAMMELYKKENVNPASSCLPTLLQLPILIAVYQVFQDGFKPESLDMLYSFVARPLSLDPLFLGIPYFDMSKPIILFAVLAAVAQYFMTKMLVTKKQPNVAGGKDEGASAMINKQMLYMMPVLTIVFGFTLPGGVSFYWLLTTLIQVLQQYMIFHKKKSDPNPPDILPSS